MEITHKVFGEIIYNGYWTKLISVDFINKERMVDLLICGDEDADFEDGQIDGFEEFESKKNEIINSVEVEIYNYYLSVYKECRERFGDQADVLAPSLNNVHDLDKLIELKNIIIPETFDLNEREVGFIFDAVWEPELGIGVKCVNGEVIEVGTQDIVL